VKICVLIPVHNESLRLGGIVHSLKNKKLDVLVIDDGSDDNSQMIAQEQGAVVLRNEEKRGKGYSLREGFDYILQHKYDGVITMDGDGQHDVNDIDAFLKATEDKKNLIVIGNRMVNPQDMPWIRKITNQLMSSMISLVSGRRLEDTQCGYRYISSQVLHGINLTSTNYEIESL